MATITLTGSAGRSGAAGPQAWPDPVNDALDVRAFENVEFQVVGTPGVAYAPQRSLDGNTFVACNVFDKDLNPLASISAAGIYTMDGGGYVKLAGGSGSTVTVRAS
jgi:hypothetical protein